MSPEAQQAQIDKMLQSASFARAPSLCRLLSFLATESICGRGDQLNETLIGVMVVNPSFDPSNTIVRKQVGNLRDKLKQYRSDEGAPDLMIVDIPVGQYAVTFRLCEVGDEDPSLPDTQPRPEPAQLRFVMVLTGTVNERDKPLVEAMVKHLRTLSGDMTLTLENLGF